MSGISVGTALIAAAAVGAGTSLYTAHEQRQAQRKAADERNRIAAEEKARMDQINADKRPVGESATVDFGTGADGDFGSVNDFLVKPDSKSIGKTGLAASGSSGLASTGALQSALGM